jgi:hypothetical protein
LRSLRGFTCLGQSHLGSADAVEWDEEPVEITASADSFEEWDHGRLTDAGE